MLDFPLNPVNGQYYFAPTGNAYQWQTPPGIWNDAGSAGLPGPSGLVYASLVLLNNAALAAFSVANGVGAVLTQGRVVAGDGGGGTWVFLKGDHSVSVTRDPFQGCFIAPNSTMSGASGVWARQVVEGEIVVDWFGAKGDGVTDDVAALTAASNFCQGGTLKLAQKAYRIASTWLIDGVHNPMKVTGQGQGVIPGLGSRIIVDTGNTDGIVCSNFDHGCLERFDIEGPPGPARLTGGYLLRLRDSGGYVVIRDMLIQRGYRLFGVSSGLGFFCHNIRTRQSCGDIAWHSFSTDPTDPSYPAGFQCIDCSFGAADIRQRYNALGNTTTYKISLFVWNLAQVRLTLISRVNYSKQRLVQGTQAQVTSGQINITSLTWAAGVGTATCSAAHGIPVGSHFTIIGATPAAFNGRWVALPTSTTTVLNFTMVDVAITSQTWLATDTQNPTLTGIVTAVVRNRIPIGTTFVISGATPAAYSGTFTALPGTTPTMLKYSLPTNPGACTTAGTLVVTPTPATATVPGQTVKWDYWVEQDPAGSDAVIAHFASPPPTNTYIDATREQPGYFDTTQTSPIYGLREPVLFLFEGRSGSNKFTNSSGGFSGDGFVVRANDPGSNAGAFMFANWGLENVAGDGLRIEEGNDFRLSTGYLAADGNAINVVFDPLSVLNIANASLQPGAPYNGPVRITTTVPHGLPFPAPDPITPGNFVYPTVLVTGVLSSPKIFLVNGRWFASVVDALNFDLIASSLYAVAGQDPLLGAPSIWKQNFDDPEPVYTAGTGRWNNKVPGAGNVRITNCNFRGNGLSSARFDMPGCMVTNSQLTTAGRYNKDFFGDNVVSIANNGSGAIRATLKYPSDFLVNDAVVHLVHVTKAGVTDATLRDTRYRCTQIDFSTYDLVGSTYAGPYDAPTDSAPVFLLSVGVPLELCVNASASIASGNEMGDWTPGGSDPQDYAIINKCPDLLNIHDNFVGGVGITAINNFAPGQRQRWLNNYDYTDYGARTTMRYDDGTGNAISERFGTGSPEGVVTGNMGAAYTDTSTGILWSKRTTTGNTGWQQGTAQREESGTFVPSLTFAVPGDLTVSSGTTVGTYTRIGNVVEIFINMTFTPTFTAAASGEVRIAGLPFNAAYSTDGLSMISSNSNVTWPTNGLDFRAITVNAQSYLRLQVIRSAAINSAMVSTNLVSGVSTSWVFNGSYRV